MPRCLLVLMLALWMAPSVAATIPQSLAECNALCDQYFQGGDVTPPVVPPTGTKPYPGKVTFDKTSDQGTGDYYGTACLLIDPGMVKVVLNGEVALKGNMYGSRDVWRFLKVGDGYPKPWNFVFTHTDGTVYTYVVIASASTDGPAGGNTETVRPSSYGNGDRGNARFSKTGAAYGKNIQVWIDGVLKMTVTDGSKRQEGKNGLIWKPVSDSNGKLVVVGEYKVHYSSCTLKW